MAEDALAFRVLRLAKPTLDISRPLRFVLDEDTASDYARLNSHNEASTSATQEVLTGRVQMQSAVDACGVSGRLMLSKSFGEAYLGESFVGYVSLVNKSTARATEVIVKVELQTARQKVVLYDNATAPLPLMGPGHRHEFMVQHDIKELGMHTLVCSTVYTAADGERRYFPENFKFSSSNPLYVKTKTRQVAGSTFLEACIENSSKGPMSLEYVRFDATPPLIAHNIDIRDAMLDDFTTEDPLSGYIDQLQVLDVGCSYNHLFRLSRPHGSSLTDSAGSALGKLEIKWRGSMGEVGRLQTQQILGAPAPAKEVDIAIVSMAEKVCVESPFNAVVKLQSHVDRQLGPLTLTMGQVDAGLMPPDAEQLVSNKDRGMLQLPANPSSRITADMTSCPQEAESQIVVCGITKHEVDQLPPNGSKLIDVSFVALAAGVQQLSGLALQASDSSRVYDRLQPIDILVEE